MGIENNFDLRALFGGIQPKRNISTDEANGKKDLENVPVGQPQVKPEDNMVGMDTFVRTSDVAQTTGAEALAAQNRAKIQPRHSDRMPQVNASPAATEARLTAALGNVAPLLATEAGVPLEATVNIAPEILSNINVNPLLAQYLNSADETRIEQAMKPFMQLA